MRPLVRGASRYGAVPRHVPGPAFGAPAAARRVGRRRRTEARRACEYLAASDPSESAGRLLPAGRALSRARRVDAGADEAYRQASRPAGGRSPAWRCCAWPRVTRVAADAAIRSALHETKEPRARAQVLARGGGDPAGGRRSRRRLAPPPASWTSSPGAPTPPLLRAAAAHAAGAVALAAGEPREAVARLREAWDLVARRPAPYEVARVRTLVGSAYRGARRRGGRAHGARRGPRACSSSWGRGPSVEGVGGLARQGRAGAQRRPDGARGRGAAADCRRQDQPRNRGRALRSARRPWPVTSATSSPSSTSPPAPPPPPTPSATTSSDGSPVHPCRMGRRVPRAAQLSAVTPVHSYRDHREVRRLLGDGRQEDQPAGRTRSAGLQAEQCADVAAGTIPQPLHRGCDRIDPVDPRRQRPPATLKDRAHSRCPSLDHPPGIVPQLGEILPPER